MAEETKLKKNEKVTRNETNEIFIGNKPFMKYVIATIMQLDHNQNAIIKARGKFISRGVDVAEVVKKRLKETNNLDLNESIKIGTEEFKSEEGKQVNVSTIDISLIKK